MDNAKRTGIIEAASRQVGRPLFFSTIIIVVSFLPVFLLTGQEHKLFAPLAWTKTFVLLGSAILAVTLVPVLMTFFLKGSFRAERENPVSRFFEAAYHPVLLWALRRKKLCLGLNLAALALAIPLYLWTGSEFMPPLDEGSLLFMPVTLPDVSNAEVKRILQLQDKIIVSVPEVASVLGKAGRASTATDNSPISMIETIIMLKPRREWRKGVTKNDIINELDIKLRIPGVVNGWTQPIINRINMLSTGIRTDVGIKVYGENIDSIFSLSLAVKKALEGLPGIKDLYVEPITGGKYLDIRIKREALGRYGLSVDDVNAMVESSLGGMNLTATIEGRRRFPVNARFAPDFRSNLDGLRRLPITTPGQGTIPLSQVAELVFSEGPPMINSENAMLRGAVLFNVRDRDLGSTVREARRHLESAIQKLPKGYYLEWSGQWENQVRAERRLRLILPVVLLIIFMLLAHTYRSWKEAVITSLSVPFALIGGIYLIFIYQVNFSVAVAVGFIALLGVAVQTGVLMVVYLDEALARRIGVKGMGSFTRSDVEAAVVEGSVRRLRPKLMTVSTTLFGLLPVLWASGAGTDVMTPMVLPMIGGMFTSTIHVLLVTPIIFQLTKEYELKKYGKIEILDLAR